jgi:hypothetical protein
MHLDEGVEPVAQKALVLSRAHAIEQLEELFLLLGASRKQFLLLGGSRKHVLCPCMLSSAFGRAERTRGGGDPRGTRVTPSEVRMSERRLCVVFGGAC